MVEFLNFQMSNSDLKTNNAYHVEASPEKLKTTAEIQAWLVSYLTNVLKINPNEIDVTLPFDCYNMDSASAIGLSGEIEEWLECEFEPTLLYDYPTIEALTKYLANSLSIKQ
ncbi:MAG: acyl carrier protein [Brasilonema angustatum HA4187-MV1]|jgi:acyl carrier protein|nr:acyl carrier protein [Brasilonema angustatum HA4187-MV1]